MSCDERRAAILDVATQLFAERGFRGTTTRELAAALGVTEPVLYEHFRSKRDIYQAIVEAKARQRLEEGSALLTPLFEARNDRAFLCRLGEFIFEKWSEDAAYSRLSLLSGLEGGDLAHVFQKQIAAAHDLVAQYLQTRVEEGAFRELDPKIAARALLSMFAHHGLLTCVFKDDYLRQRTDKQVIEEMVELFLRGVIRNSESEEVEAMTGNHEQKTI
jgi:AcrR family transcriptional regulator